MPPTPAQQGFYDLYLRQVTHSRLDGTAALLDLIKQIKVPDDAAPEEQADLRNRIQRARSLLDDSASAKELTYAKGEIDAADAISAQIVDKLNKARNAAATLNDRLTKLLHSLPADTPAPLRDPVKAEIDTMALTLAAIPTLATEVEDIEGRMDALNTATETVVEKLCVAEEAALGLIASRPGRAFSTTQTPVFTKRVSDALERVKTDLPRLAAIWRNCPPPWPLPKNVSMPSHAPTTPVCSPEKNPGLMPLNRRHAVLWKR
tara:strand:- start:1011 stop:1796 length:786 start_codon:yes stop_codon:yes gene_type:complete